MPNVLIVAEHLNGQLNPSTARTVSAALALNPAKLDIAVLAADPAAVAAEAARISGVSRVVTVANPANAHPVAQILAPQIAALAAGYSHVFLPSTTFGKDLAPAVAALLGVNQISDLMAVENAYTFQRPIYAGNAIITVTAPVGQPVVATVRTASWPDAGREGNASIEAAEVETTLPAHTRYLELAAASSDRPDLRAGSARRKTSRLFTNSPTNSARPSVPRARQWMQAMSPTTCRSARPARSSPPSCTLPWVSAAPSST